MSWKKMGLGTTLQCRAPSTTKLTHWATLVILVVNSIFLRQNRRTHCTSCNSNFLQLSDRRRQRRPQARRQRQPQPGQHRRHRGRRLPRPKDARRRHRPRLQGGQTGVGWTGNSAERAEPGAEPFRFCCRSKVHRPTCPYKMLSLEFLLQNGGI